MGQDAGSNIATYDERMRQLVAALCEPFAGDAVNVVAAHCMVTGASLGGGERAAQTYMDYAIGAAAFPAHAHYVALGHLHRTQQIAGAAPIWYSGSPVQVDFGEHDEPNNVLLVTATRTTPAVVRPVAVEGWTSPADAAGHGRSAARARAGCRRVVPPGDRRRPDAGGPRRRRARAARGGRRRGAAGPARRRWLDRARGGRGCRGRRRTSCSPRTSRTSASTTPASPRSSPSCSTSRRPDASASRSPPRGSRRSATR